MKIVDLLTEDCVLLDVKAQTKEAVWQVMAEKMDQKGVLENLNLYLEDVKKREEKGTTGVGFGVAIPHAKSAAVKAPALVMARLTAGIDVDSLDGSKADLFFLIAAPLHGDDVHLQTLSKLARMLVHESFLTALRSAKTGAEVLQAIQAREG